MTSLLLAILFCTALSVLIWGVTKRERLIQFPFLTTTVVLGWVFPQLLGLRGYQFLPPGSLDKTILMTTLSLLACWIGYVVNDRPARGAEWSFSHGRLVIASIVFSLLGAYFFLKVDDLAEDAIAAYGGAWTGVITIYVFFSSLMTVGLAIALVLHLTKPSVPTLLVLLVDTGFYLERILIKGRRAAMVELGLMLLLALWFRRRWLPPRLAVVAAVFVGALVVNGIAEYRATMLDDTRVNWSGAGLDEVARIDFTGNLVRIAEGEAGGYELTNAAMNIEAADRQLSFDFGLSHWNNLVFSYVPAQWVGSDFKSSLMFDLGNPAYEVFRYVPHPGTTTTGMSDAFLSFWYFGAVKFLIIGYVLSRWYKSALAGSLVAQLMMMLIITSALHVITHSTHNFLVSVIRSALFLLPALVLARIGARHDAATEAARPYGWSTAR